MSKKNTNTIQWMTPWFTARFPKLQQPDTDGKFPDGKYKTDAIFDDATLVEVKATLKDAAKKLWPDQEITLPIKPFYGNKDDKAAKQNSTGSGITMKSKRKPKVFDAKRQRVPETVKIGGGSILRADVAIAGYSKTEKVRTKAADGTFTTEDETVYGINFYVNGVQVRKLVEGGDFGGASFDDDEAGFIYDGAEEDSAPFGDATDL